MKGAAALVALLSLASCRAGEGGVLVPAPRGLRAEARRGPAAPRSEVAVGAPAEFAMNTGTACARVDGRVHCGALRSDRPLSALPPLRGVDDAVDLALGGSFGCVATRRGAVLCFGDNDLGQLGAGLAAEKSDVPVPVVGVTDATRVFAGPNHACAIVAGGRVQCWGVNGDGQTGGDAVYLGGAREQNLPVWVKGVEHAIELALGRVTSCALDARGRTSCWGAPALPAQAKGAEGFVFPPLDALAASPNRAFCGLRRGRVACWGHLEELTFGEIDERAPSPVAGLDRVKRVKITYGRGCALHDSGDVSCWGQSAGPPDDAAPPDPVALDGGLTRAVEARTVSGLPPAADLVVTDLAACAVTAGHDVYCWGVWADGSFDGMRSERLPVKVAVR